MGTDIEPLNFAEKPCQSIQHINKFVAEATRNYIKDFVTDELDDKTRFAMVNAVYFKGQWVKKNCYLSWKKMMLNIDCVHF